MAFPWLRHAPFYRLGLPSTGLHLPLRVELNSTVTRVEASSGIAMVTATPLLSIGTDCHHACASSFLSSVRWNEMHSKVAQLQYIDVCVDRTFTLLF